MRYLVAILLGAFAVQVLHAKEAISMEHAIPSNNWYTAPMIIPIKQMPIDIQYPDVKCSIIESFVEYALRDWMNSGFLNEDEEEKYMDAFNNCKFTICSNDKLVEKLSNDPTAMMELATMLLSVSKQVLPNYAIFRFVVDPYYWDFTLDIPYPIVTQEAYLDQNDAVFKIIQKVCGHQNLTLKSKLIPEVVNQIFLDILIDAYIPEAFLEGDKQNIVSATEPNELSFLWSNGVTFRKTDGICLDPALTETSERTSISRVRDTAIELGVDCQVDDGGPVFEEGNFGSSIGGAPGSPGGGSSTGGAPGRPSSASWAGPPSSGNGPNGFAPRG